MKRKMAYIGLSYAAALFTASFLSYSASFLMSAVLLLASAALFFTLKINRTVAVTICVSICIGFLSSALYSYLIKEPTLSLSGKEMTVDGYLKDFSHYSSDTMRISVSGKADGIPCEVSFFTDSCELDYYDAVTVKATLNEIENDIDFSSKDYYSSKGIYLEGDNVTDIEVRHTNFSLRRLILKYRDFLFDKITEFLPGDSGGFLGAMLCGDKSSLSDDAKQSLYRSGLGHIFALSGTHLVIITSLIYSVRSIFLGNKKLISGITLIFIAAFVVFAGASVSVLRAALMSALVHSASLFNRKADPLNSLGLSAFIILVFSPYAVTSASFILSFAGAFAVSVISPMLLKRFDKTRFYSLLSVVMPPLTASLVTIPVSLFYFNEVSLISPLTNILLIPMSTFSLTVTALAAVFGGFSIISNPLLFIASIPVKAVLKLSSLLSSLPFSYIGTYSVLINLVIIALCSSVLILLIRSGSLSKALIRSYSAFCIALSFSLLYKLFFLNELSIYYIAKSSSQAVIATNGSCCAVFDIGGKGDCADAVNDILEKRLIGSADLFMCKNPSYIKACYNDALSSDILSYNPIEQSELSIPPLGISAVFENNVLKMYHDGKTYTFSEEKTKSSEQLSKYFSLQNQIKYDILNEKYID